VNTARRISWEQSAVRYLDARVLSIVDGSAEQCQGVTGAVTVNTGPPSKRGLVCFGIIECRIDTRLHPSRRHFSRCIVKK
jgi:hypothetical protein